jgi:hypothetical protein
VTYRWRVLLARSVLALLFVLPACVEARTPSDEPPCASEAECTSQYRSSMRSLQSCILERKKAGYVSPGGPTPPQCAPLEAEVAARASALRRFRSDKPHEQGGEEVQSYEVPPLPDKPANAGDLPAPSPNAGHTPAPPAPSPK